MKKDNKNKKNLQIALRGHRHRIREHKIIIKRARKDIKMHRILMKQARNSYKLKGLE